MAFEDTYKRITEMIADDTYNIDIQAKIEEMDPEEFYHFLCHSKYAEGETIKERLDSLIENLHLHDVMTYDKALDSKEFRKRYKEEEKGNVFYY